MAGISQHVPALRRQVQAAGKPLEKPYLIGGLQLSHGLADGGLGDIQRPGGAAHGTVIRYGSEDFQMAKRHGTSLYR